LNGVFPLDNQGENQVGYVKYPRQVTEIIAYTGRCTAAAQRLRDLSPVPLTIVVISEFGL
jgi:hypothetical protein